MEEPNIQEDAATTIAECVQSLQRLSQAEKNFFSVNTKGPEMTRVLQNVLFLLRDGGPLLEQVKDEWRMLLSVTHSTNDRAFLFFLVESITLGLKLYQHPEIGVSLLTPNEDNRNDEKEDQG